MRWPWRRSPIVAPAIVAGLCLIAWPLWLLQFRGWIAHNDFAIFRLTLERELDGHVPAVGAFSRLGVFHPGPLREWAFALPYWLSGRRAAALPATALLLNSLWVVWTAAVAVRFRSQVLRVAALCGLGLTVVALGENAASPWNPHLAILPLHLACWALVALVEREGHGWLAVVVPASFAAQLHASALIAGAVLIVIAAGAVAVTRRSELRVAVGFVVVTAALWSGPLVDLRHGGDANLVRIARARSSGPSVGVGDALGHASRLLQPWTMLTGDAVRPTVELFEGWSRMWLLVVVVALVSAIVRSRTGGERVALAPAALALVMLGVTVATITLFVEPAYRYLYGPLQAVAVFVLTTAVAVVSLAVRADGDERDSGRAWASSIVAAVVAVCVVGGTLAADDREASGRHSLQLEPTVTRELAAHPDWSRVAVAGVDLRGASVDAELADVVYRAGREVRSRRFGLGLEAPEGTEPVLVAAMGAGRECLLALDGRGALVDGVIESSGEPIAIFAFDAGRDDVAQCLRTADVT